MYDNSGRHINDKRKPTPFTEWAIYLSLVTRCQTFLAGLVVNHIPGLDLHQEKPGEGYMSLRETTLQ